METPASKPTSEPSSLNLTTRRERSLYTYIIHSVIRPFRSHLGRPKSHQPKGSITLKPNLYTKRKCNITHRTVCDINVYDLVPKTPTPTQTHSRKSHLYYFCGGGWQSPPSSQHWQLCVRMARDLPAMTVSLVSYPLAPKNAAPTAFPWLLRFYRAILRAADDMGEKVILAGDSSGANIILCLTLEALREDSLSHPLSSDDPEKANTGEDKQEVDLTSKPSHPIALLATCPSTDLTRANPSIKKLAPLDPILTPDFVNSTAKAWAGEWDASDPRLSPLNADISLLAKSGIAVHGITGGHDILSPDGVLLREKCKEVGVRGEWLHWEKQMHCFVLTAGYGVPEAKEAIDWAMKVLLEE
ncbi:unnamed protein product [Periconia digitata]|uniref:Alpha/beta hydrolase fold-3 domain-containing protein n=1 Tax=Periconia digitata TaxID=1303443 RepID=A0A9W4U6Q9_9PLEO|nr:unnamed protein product [Periconia digitata]